MIFFQGDYILKWGPNILKRYDKPGGTINRNTRHTQLSLQNPPKDARDQIARPTDYTCEQTFIGARKIL